MKPRELGGAQEFLSLLRDGDRIYVHDGCAEPSALLEALAQDREHRDLTVFALLPMGPAWQRLLQRENIQVCCLFPGPPFLSQWYHPRVNYLPCHYSQITTLFEEGLLQVEVVLLRVSPPDSQGLCSLGNTVGHLPSILQGARTVIAEVDPHVPYTLGESHIPSSRLDYILETAYPCVQYHLRDPDAAEVELARHVASLIPDRATIQVGIGSLPSAILKALKDKADLGVHTGMMSDALMELIQAGNVTNRYQGLHPGKTVATMAMGSQRLFEFIHCNPAVEFHPAAYTHGIGTLAQINNFMAINSALEVDLLGRVNSEWVSGRWLGGVGGQGDFLRGARASRGGKAILALTSTTREGHSRVVPFLDRRPVTTLATDVDFVVTEYGIADLRGKTLKERAAALIAVAHPDHRPSLARSFQQEWERARR